jgi:hypothetical protein
MMLGLDDAMREIFFMESYIVELFDRDMAIRFNLHLTDRKQ